MNTKRHLHLFAALVMAATMQSLGPVNAIDPDLPYNSASSGADGALTFREIVTPGRRLHQMVYDVARQQVVLYGGYSDPAGGGQNDTWLFSGNDWRQAQPAQSPPARYQHMMVYDGARQEVVVFGGILKATGGATSETWIWNGTTWTQRVTGNTPNARYSSAITYDAAHQQVVMFGGQGGADETWIYDGVNWNLRTPAARPPADVGASMTFDAARQKVVLFLGNRQTWTWDGNNWANVTPAVTPPNRGYGAMDYDAERQEVVLFGGSDRSDTWVWNGSIWTERTPANHPEIRRESQAMAYHPGRKQIIFQGGHIPGVNSANSDTWFWNGTDWAFWSGATQTFDMTSRASGVWNFTSIDVPPGVTVAFKKNAANTPVRWLATRDVTIRGTVSVDGEYGAANLPPGVVAQGGPGGFNGGDGAVRFDRSSSYAGTPGSGPGGGAAATDRVQQGGDGLHNQPGGYGNNFLQPLIGGSGGGGGGSSENTDGGNGGGGGGAVLIASSRDIILTGLIRANGGNRQHSGVTYGGRGAGGSILIRADRFSGPGTFQAFGGDAGNDNGRIRIEAYDRNFTGATRPGIVYSLPIAGQDFSLQGTLTVSRIAGQNVQQPPGASLISPDVIFTQAGPIEVTVIGQNIPNGTEIRLRVTTSTGVLTAGPEFLNAGSALFTLSVPAGTGTVQAFADYRITN